MRPILLLLLLSLPAAPVFAQSLVPAATEHETTLNKIFGMVAPDEPSQLTEAKRFHLYLLSAGGPIPILGEAIGAGFSQWENSPEEWGQGWNAYGHRFGSNLAYNGIRQTITYGTSVVFHEDNRYFASHKHGLWVRTGISFLTTAGFNIVREFLPDVLHRHRK